MYLLLIQHYLSTFWIVIAAALLAVGSVWIMLVSRRRTGKVFKRVIRSAAVLLCLPFLLLCSFWVFFRPDAYPHKTAIYRSGDGSHVALLVHSEDRDSAMSRVTVKVGCCRVVTVYEYFGYESDYADWAEPKAVEWADNQHLVIRYALDQSDLPTIQKCLPEVGSITVSCEPRPGLTVPAISQR